jgi:hypothetical protein
MPISAIQPFTATGFFAAVLNSKSDFPREDGEAVSVCELAQE